MLLVTDTLRFCERNRGQIPIKYPMIETVIESGHVAA